MPFSGIFGICGQAKENALGTVTPPTKFRRYIPPFDFNTDKTPIISEAISGVADLKKKWAEGPALLKGGKMKYEVEPEGGIEEDLMAIFGVDTLTEVATFTVVAHTVFTVVLSTNDSIDFVEGAGAQCHATLTPGNYTAYKLCAEIKTQLETANGTAVTYTVTFSPTTKKFTITPSASTVTLLWLTGTNNAKGAYALVGWGHTDTDAAGVQTSTGTVTFVASNDAIPFIEGAGLEKTAYLTAGTYIMGASSAIALSLCKEIKTQMESANGTADVYTVTYSYTTKKLTIMNGTEVFVLKWTDGVDASISAMSLLGFTADSASALTAVSDSTTTQFVMSHAFTRIQSATMPSYTWWQKNGVDYPQHAGCLLNKLDINFKKGEFVTADAEWVGIKYDATGVTQVTSFTAISPFKFNQVVPTLGGTPNTDLEELKISIVNTVSAEHVIGNTIYATKNISHGLAATISGTLIFEDVTEWAKFIGGTSTSLTVVLTSPTAIVGTHYYTLTITIPLMYYRSANIPIQKGLMKVAFSADAILDPNTSATITASMINSVGAAY